MSEMEPVEQMNLYVAPSDDSRRLKHHKLIPDAANECAVISK